MRGRWVRLLVSVIVGLKDKWFAALRLWVIIVGAIMLLVFPVS